jgi:hypothetical protein
MKHKIVIQRHRPWLRATLIAGSASVLVIGAVAIYGVTRRTTVSDFREAQTELQQLRSERRELTKQLRAARNEVEDLKEEYVYATRSQQIDTDACTQVKTSLADLQNEAAELREQVAFYRGIVSPKEAQAGLRVLEMKAKPTDTDNVWDLEYVLIQSQRHDKRVTGELSLRVIGSQNGETRTLPLDQLLLPDSNLNGYAFKYFQEFTTRFRLPDGFRPIQIAVTLVPADKSAPSIDDQLEWNRIIPAADNPAPAETETQP